MQTIEVIGTAPTPTGGTVVPGTYLLTSAKVYRASAGGPTPSLQITRVFTATQFATRSYSDGQPQPFNSGTYSTSGTNLSLSFTCPATVTNSTPYTSTPTTLTLYETFGTPDVYEWIHTKQ